MQAAKVRSKGNLEGKQVIDSITPKLLSLDPLIWYLARRLSNGSILFSLLLPMPLEPASILGYFTSPYTSRRLPALQSGVNDCLLSRPPHRSLSEVTTRDSLHKRIVGVTSPTISSYEDR